MALIPGSSSTDPRYANFNPGRPLTAGEIALRNSMGGLPMSSPTNQNASNYGGGMTVNTAGAGAGAGSGGTGGTPSAPSGDNLGVGLAESETDRRIRMIRELFDQGKEQVNNYRTNIGNRFNDISKAIGDFRDRSKTQFNDSGQQIVNRASDILGSNATTAQELAGTANAQGRTLGLSSKVNLGGKLLGNLQQSQGNTLAKRGEEDRANLAVLTERNDQAQSQENDAVSARDEGNRNADLYDRQNLANFGDNYEGAQLNFATLLNNILGKSEALTAMKGPDASGLTAYSPSFDGIVNTINGTLSSMPSGSGGVSSDAANLANPQTYADYLKKFKGLYTG